MKTKKSAKEGSIAIVMLLLAMIITLIVGSYALVSSNNKKITRHAVKRMETQILVESAVSLGAEAFYEALKIDPTIRYDLLARNLNRKRNQFKNLATTSFKKNEGYVIDNLHFTCARMGRTNRVTIVAAASNRRTSDIKTGMLVTYQVIEVSFLDYAIFSDGIFELAPWPRMDIYGDVRGNDLVRIGAKYGLYFHNNLWTTDLIDVVPVWGKSESAVAQMIYAKAKDGTNKNFYDGEVLDGQNPNWEVLSESRWGENVLKGGTTSLQVPTGNSDNHLLIEPRDIVNDDALLQREKLAWKAMATRGVMITVNQNGEVYYEENGDGNRVAALPRYDIAEPLGKDTGDGTYELKKYKIGRKNYRGWVDVDDSFSDGRETRQGVRVVNLYMDQLMKKFPNAKLIYVQVEDEDGNLTPFLEAQENNSSLKLPAVRIRNGHDISAASSGLTVATHRMTYIEGNYNKVDKVSALIAADNVVVLSNGWDDRNKYKKRPGGTLDTWYQAAFLIGGYTYNRDAPSGNIEGFQNLVRYRENWGGLGKTFYYDGSYVKLFNSQETTGAAVSAWFRAPNRVVTYNSDFVDNPPPGMPTALAAPEIVEWRELTWDEAQNLIP